MDVKACGQLRRPVDYSVTTSEPMLASSASSLAAALLVADGPAGTFIDPAGNPPW